MARRGPRRDHGVPATSEAETAAATDDGHRAWVIRDALSKLDPADADAIRARLDGIRRRAGAPTHLAGGRGRRAVRRRPARPADAGATAHMTERTIDQRA